MHMVTPPQMVLPPVNIRYKYKAMMFTFGPIPVVAQREDIRRVVSDHFGEKLKANTIALETGKDGYRHCHVAVDLHSEVKPPMKLITHLKAFCLEDDTGRKPNCGTHFVPNSESKGLRAYSVLHKYLTDPGKIKETDDGALEFLAPLDGMARLRVIYREILESLAKDRLAASRKERVPTHMIRPPKFGPHMSTRMLNQAMRA